MPGNFNTASRKPAVGGGLEVRHLPLAPENLPVQRITVDFGVWAFAWLQD